MQRISTASAVANLFGPGKNGFTDGDPVGGIPTTWLEAAWFNALQEEVANAIEKSGIVLEGTKRDQLYDAIVRLAGSKAVASVRSSKESFGSVRLVYEGGSLRLLPWYGNAILIGDTYRELGAAVALAAPQAANTTYFLYAAWVGGEVVLEASTTVPVRDPATLQMRKAGDLTRSYVGVAQSSSNEAWQDTPLVASHYNSVPRVNFAGNASGNSIASLSYVPIGPSVPFVTDDGYFVAIGQASVASQNDIAVSSVAPHIALALDNTGGPYAQAPRIHSAAMMGATCFAAAQAISRGRHVINMIGNAVPGNVLYYDNMDLMVLTNG